jgi:hypothetical protein
MASTTSKRAVDPVGEFFAALAAQGHVATFDGDSATLRFDIGDDGDVERWHVAVTKGNVAVTRQGSRADAVVRITRPCAEALVTGRLNAQAALLRGLLTCEGSLAALVMFQRCLPGPPGATGRAAPISAATIMARRRPS